ncbi:MAG: ketol-acid reductoisomerase [Planctomycetota bacterium]|nr:MAG: ketol-acid reductoisomerase [Planctomycetota bacterium]
MSRARIIPPESATVAPLRGRTISVLGYGAQGSAHALNLRDSGLDVLVAQRAGGPRYEQARRDGFDPVDIPTAAARGDLLVFALPDDAAGAIYREQIAPHVRAGQTLGFIHGFVIHYEQVTPPADVDVVMVAPKAQGRGVRSEFVAGRGVLSLIAVHQDATGQARETALAWAAGIGSHRAGLVETTFADETETDLFGEQAVLCGGLSALIRAGFDTLVAAGYPEELAYFECCHEVKLLADLIHERGIAGMRERISSTARYGDVTRGPRVVDEHVRETMRTILDEIRSGEFAREMLADHASGAPRLRALCEADREHVIEAVGRRMRALMWGADDPSAGDG